MSLLSNSKRAFSFYFYYVACLHYICLLWLASFLKCPSTPFRCVGGFLQLSSKFSGTVEDYADYQDPDELAICGPNERYSPPIVIFKDPKDGKEESGGANTEAASATLLFRVDETTSRSQFLAHFAFPSMDHPDTGVALKGATRLDKEGGNIFIENSAILNIVRTFENHSKSAIL